MDDVLGRERAVVLMRAAMGYVPGPPIDMEKFTVAAMTVVKAWTGQYEYDQTMDELLDALAVELEAIEQELGRG